MKKLTSYTIELDIPTTPDAVYRALTEAALIEQWIWGKEAARVKAEIDLRVSGVFRVACAAQGEVKEPWGEDWAFEGYLVICEPAKRFAYLQRWLAPVGYNEPGMNPLDEMVDIVLEAQGSGTLLRYTHSGIPDDGSSAKHHEMAVRSTLNDLSSVAAGLKA